jgi:hypothetical protein
MTIDTNEWRKRINEDMENITRADLFRLVNEIERLRRIHIEGTNKLEAVLPLCYLGWDVFDAAVAEIKRTSA